MVDIGSICIDQMCLTNLLAYSEKTNYLDNKFSLTIKKSERHLFYCQISLKLLYLR